jgi:group I intron endonuclease
MAVIYKATNTVNGKSYIGFAVNFDTRQKTHFKKVKRTDKQYFHNAINKYGIDSFEWTILKENATLEDEIILIKEHETFWKTGKGYNLTKGGEGKLGYETSEKTKQKISNSHKGKIISEKQLKILRFNAQRMKEVGHTEEVKKRISNAHKGRIFSKEHKDSISRNHASKKPSGSFYKSEEYKQKMAESCKGKTRTPEQKERYRQAALKREQLKREVMQGF